MSLKYMYVQCLCCKEHEATLDTHNQERDISSGTQKGRNTKDMKKKSYIRINVTMTCLSEFYLLLPPSSEARVGI